MSRQSVLLLEDNADEAELMRYALREKGVECELIVVEDGQQAIETVDSFLKSEGQDCQPELRLVILDLKVPGMAGDQVLRVLKADVRTRPIPVLMLTSSCLPSEVNRLYEYGANALLRKPVTLSGLLDLVGAMVDFWFSPDLIRAEGR
jgi:CheY-like chemotaxis protein